MGDHTDPIPDDTDTCADCGHLGIHHSYGNECCIEDENRQRTCPCKKFVSKKDKPMADTLKPCPFCGSPAAEPWAGRTYCTNHKCLLGWCGAKVEEWQHRAPDPLAEQTAEILAGLLELAKHEFSTFCNQCSKGTCRCAVNKAMMEVAAHVHNEWRKENPR